MQHAGLFMICAGVVHWGQSAQSLNRPTIEGAVLDSAERCTCTNGIMLSSLVGCLASTNTANQVYCHSLVT